MNYLMEIISFAEWKEVNPLPASAIVLWYELMAICNKTGWMREFTVPNGLLQVKCSLSRKEFELARQTLMNVGLIEYKKSNRVNQAGKYILIPFDKNNPDCLKRTTRGTTKGTTEQTTGGATERTTKGAHNINLNINKNNNIIRVCELYENKIKPICSDIEKDKVLDMANSYPLVWIEAAIDKAVDNNARNELYVLGILKNWEKYGFGNAYQKAGGKKNASNSRGDDQSVCETAGEDGGSEPISCYFQGRKIF